MLNVKYPDVSSGSIKERAQLTWIHFADFLDFCDGEYYSPVQSYIILAIHVQSCNNNYLHSLCYNNVLFFLQKEKAVVLWAMY